MVDLIPADYRRGRRLQQHLARFAIDCATVLCAVAAVRAALDYALHAERAQGALVSSQ